MFAAKRSQISDDREAHVVRTYLDGQPKGYSRVTAYLNSDSGAAVFRRFCSLYSRELLYLQAELSELEKKLARLDEADLEADADKWRVGYTLYSKNLDCQNNEARRLLIEEIGKKLIEYDELLLRYSELRKLRWLLERMHRNFMDFLYTADSFGPQDQGFFYHKDDFIALEDTKECWLDELIARLMGNFRVHAHHTVKLHKYYWTDWEPGARENLDTYSQRKFDFDGVGTGQPLSIPRRKEIFGLTPEPLEIWIKILWACMTTSLLLIPVFLLNTLVPAWNRVRTGKWLVSVTYRVSRVLEQMFLSLDGTTAASISWAARLWDIMLMCPLCIRFAPLLYKFPFV